MTKYTHIIWDWNGTLFDDTWLCLEIMDHQLMNIGKQPISYETYQRLFDFPVRNFYEKIGFDFSIVSYETIAQYFIDEYTQRRFECSLHRGVPPILDKFIKFGCSHSVLSAYAENELFKMLDHYAVSHFFTHVIGLNNHYASGKIREGKILLEKLAMPLENLVLIGDTVHDFEVARELGIACILVSNGHHGTFRLDTCGAPVVQSLSAAMVLVID